MMDPTAPQPVSPAEWDARIARARAGGATWDEIDGFFADKAQTLAAAGKTPQEVRAALGMDRPGPQMTQLQAYAQAHIRDYQDKTAEQPTAANPIQSFLGGWSDGLVAQQTRRIETGHATAGNFQAAPDENLLMSATRMAGQLAGDAPGFMGFFLASEAATAPAASGAGALAGAAVPGAGEVGISEGAGAALANIFVAGHNLGAAMGGVAMMHAQYADEIKHGAWGSWNDKSTWARAGDIAAQTAQGYALGVATGGTGAAVDIGLEGAKGMLATQAGKFVARSASQVAVQGGVSAGLQGRLPTAKDWIDASLMVALMEAGGATARITTDRISRARVALAAHYADTGQDPISGAKDALSDPALRQKLNLPPPEYIPGSAFHGAPGDTMVLPRGRSALLTSTSDRALGPTAITGVNLLPGIKNLDARDIDTERVIHATEGGLTRDGAPRVSPAGAIGEWQIMPATAKEVMGHDYDTSKLFDRGENARVHEVLMEKLRRQFPGDQTAQLIAYNAGPGRAEKFVRSSPGTMLKEIHDPLAPGGRRWEKVASPRDESGLPLETQRYLAHARYLLNTDGLDVWGDQAKDKMSEATIKALFPEPGEEGIAGRRTPREEKTPDQMELDLQRQTQLDAAQRWEDSGLDAKSLSDDDLHSVLAGREATGQDGGPTTAEKLKKWGAEAYYELFNPASASQKAVAAVIGGRSLSPFDNPNYVHRWADIAKSQYPVYMIDHNMIDTDGMVVGKGLTDVLKPFQDDPKAFRDFRSYAIAKWAVEKAEQGKETGVNLDAAKERIAREEAKGLRPPVLDWRVLADQFGVPVKTHSEKRDLMQLIGPHYSHKDQAIHLSDADEATTLARYGKGLTPDVIAQHELGHAIAFKFGKAVGKGDWSGLDPKLQEDLADELEIVSRKFKPGLWEDFRQRTHVTKTSELMADAVATWITDPVARTHMPVFEKLLNQYHDQLMPFGGLGEKPVKWGTPTQQAFEEIQDWQNGTLRFLKDSGVISRDQYIRWVVENRARIPGYREPEDEATPPGNPKVGRNVYNPVRAFKGSDLMIKNMVQSLMQDAYVRVQMGAENLALQSELRLHTMIGDVQAVPGTPIKINLSPEELKSAGLNSDELDGNLSIFRKLPGVGHDEIPIFTGGQGQRYKFADPILTRYLKGMDTTSLGTLEKATYAFTRFTKKLITTDPGFAIRIAAYDAPWQFITQPGGLVNTAHEWATGVAIGVGHLIGHEETSALYDKWVRSGGASRVLGTLSRDEFIKERLKSYYGDGDKKIADMAWNTITEYNPLKALKVFADVMTQAQQVGRFARVDAQGKSMLEAGVRSSEAAFHSGRVGPWTSRLDAQIPFLGAYLKGLEKTARSLVGGGPEFLGSVVQKVAGLPENPIGPNVGLTGERYSALKTYATATAVLTMPALAQWALNKDKEWYKAAPPWQRDNGWLFHLGPDNGHGTTVFVKAPPVLSVLFIGLPRRLMEAFFEDNPDAFHNFQKSIGDSFLPAGGLLTYNVIAPMIEHMANHSFFHDKPLVSDDEKAHVGTADQGVAYSSMPAKVASRFLNEGPLRYIFGSAGLSPPVIDNYIQQWGGTLGNAAVQAVDRISDPDKYAGAPWTEWPLARSFFARYPSADPAPVMELRDDLTKFDQVHGSLMADIKTGNMDRFKAEVERNPTAAMAHAIALREGPFTPNLEPYIAVLETAGAGGDRYAAQLIVNTERAMTRMHKYLSAVQAASTTDGFTPTDKRQLLDQGFATQQVMAERALEVMHQVNINGKAPYNPAARVALEEALDKMQRLQMTGPGQQPPPEEDDQQ